MSAKIKELYEIFGTGLVLSTSHEAILLDVPPENIKAMFKTINSISG